MPNSSLLVFSICKNIETYIQTSKNDTKPIMGCLPANRFKNVRGYYKKPYQRLYNDLENHYYLIEDLAIYLLYLYIFQEEIDLKDVTAKNILEVKKLFTLEQLQNDKDVLTKVKQELKFTKANEFFTIREDGTSVIFVLIKQKIISPVVFMKYYPYILSNEKEDVIFKTVEYLTFEKSIKKIREILKRRMLHEQKEVSN